MRKTCADILKIKQNQGCLGSSVGHLNLDFDSGRDLRVVGSSCLSDSLLSGCLPEVLSPSLFAPPHRTLSSSKINE